MRSLQARGALSAQLLPAVLLASALGGQSPEMPSVSEARLIEGTISRGTREAPLPVVGAWAVLHRFGNDRAGPLDSVRTDASGGYRIPFRATGDSNAVYFVATVHHGVAYFTAPSSAPQITGDAGAIIVFDTTHAPGIVRVAGRHLIVGSPNPDQRRPVAEIFELINDSTVTVVAREDAPAWSTPVPRGAARFEVDRSAEIPADAVRLRDGRAELFAPVGPGVRRLAFTYDAPTGAFPLELTVGDSTEQLEVLIQEPAASVSGAGLTEAASVENQGIRYRRFVARGILPGAVIRVTVPSSPRGAAGTAVLAIVALLVIAMIAAGLVAMRRRRGAAPPASDRSAAPSPAANRDTLVAELARLDAAFEQVPSPTPAQRAAYEQQRAALKGRLAPLLAGPPVAS